MSDKPAVSDSVHHDRFDYSAITARPPLRWPNGARVAVWVIPNIEHFRFDPFAERFASDFHLIDGLRSKPRNGRGFAETDAPVCIFKSNDHAFPFTPRSMRGAHNRSKRQAVTTKLKTVAHE